MYGTTPTALTTEKKMGNPQNYKIVKCKYWEKGKYFIKQMEHVDMELSAHSLMVILILEQRVIIY